MTRFARAKGSKSSNERTPEDSTPWEVMKEQLLQAKKDSEEAKKREEAENQRLENYENFLKDLKVQKRKASWCEFPESESKKTKVVFIETPQKNKNKQKLLTDNNQEDLSNPQGEINVEDPQKIKKNKQKKLNSNSKTDNVSYVNTVETKHASPKKKKKNKQKYPSDNDQLENVSNLQSDTKDANLPKSKKNKQKNKFSNNNQPEDDSNVNNLDSNSKIPKKQKQNENSEDNLLNEASPMKKKKNNKPQYKLEEDKSSNYETANNITEIHYPPAVNKNNDLKKAKKQKRVLKGQPLRRKPINDRSFQLIINGKEVELVRFDGFPIMKKDADRLEELKTNMIKKGIPKSEVQRTLKLERRRAEKALARLKRDVCYNCRKGGHNLSDCPELKSKIPGVGAADGICFKCGSTEHKQFECKVQRDKEFRFATCFICREAGHIARQCPDNPKGLYPNGGCCKLCGDVTHLRKDCPTATDKKEETSIKLHTLDSTENLEGIQQKTQQSTQETTRKPKKIRF